MLRSIARLLVCALVFAQLAVSAYACPWLAPSHDATIAAAAMSEDDADAAAPASSAMPGCSGMPMDLDRDAPNLCAEHCKAGQQSAEVPSASVQPPLLTVLYAVSPALPDEAPPRPASARIDALVAASPPLAILHCVYRI